MDYDIEELIDQLLPALRRSWSRETSAGATLWTPENPAWGQCAVTSLVVQDYFGGDIVWAVATPPEEIEPGVKDYSHYFNLIGGKELDLTREQFPTGTHIPRGIPKPKSFSTTREYLLSNENTKSRYVTLSQEVLDTLNGNR